MRNLILEIINEGYGSCFKKNLPKLKPKERDYFEDMILENKLSAIFLDFLYRNKIIDLVNKPFFERCIFQKNRFQMHSLEIIKEVRLINGVFESKGLTPIYLKGIAMQREYEDIALRPLVDIDILFKKSELLKAYEILHKSNLLAADQERYIDKNNIDHFCKNSHHIEVKTKNDISIELHHRVTSINDRIKLVNCPISSDFFIDFRTVNYYGSNINIPSIENMIIHQLCHFSINTDFKNLLRTLTDIKRVANNHDIEWHEILFKYKNTKIRRSLCLSLDLMHLNKIFIKDFYEVRDRFQEFFPNQEVLNAAQVKLFHSYNEKIIGEAFFVRFFNRDSFIDAFKTFVFPKKETLIYRFKINNPTNYKLFKMYMRYFYEQVFKIAGLPSFLIFRFKNKNVKYNNSIQNWLNKD